ncbi:Carcinoembryonic antigen-related cell adhesion molecule 1 [Madurella fahalii]|uniref:Carcinoembryonic antigen-related cell adhesion molecule 1 n=1 Tax=Madurella fahalii TaxID=1157608 RepID=A0ABQ0G8P5_9PEZI
MRNVFGCVALGCALGLVGGKALKWSNKEPRWEPPRETLAYMLSLGSEPLIPTPAPRMPVPRELLARDSTDNTCAYITGDFTSPLYCATSARCVYNEYNSHIGCCDDGMTDCPIWTTCFDSTDSELFSTDNGYTLWCGQERYPHCITHKYQDDVMIGYTVLGCAVAAGTGKVWLTPTTTMDISSDTSTSSTSFNSDSTTDSGSSSTAPTSSDLPPPVQDSSSSSSSPSSNMPIGAIVGGVVGGLAAIALIILGTWALIRHNNNERKKAAEAAAIAAVQQQSPHQPPPPAPAPAPSPMDPRMSQMTQVPVQGYYGPNKVASGQYSIAASSPTMTSFSPPHSPPPPSAGYPMSEGGSPSPPPPQQMYQGYGGVPPSQPQPGQQFHQGFHQHQHQKMPVPAPGQQQGGYGGGYPQAIELPLERGDGEVRELQG